MKKKSIFVTAVMILLFANTGFSVNLLSNYSFETLENTSGGWPTSPTDVWKGDYSSIVTAENGIFPLDGAQMLKFLGTDFESASSDGIGCQVQQVVDLSSYKTVIETGSAILKASAYYNRITGDSQTDTRFTLLISVWRGEPDNYDWANWPTSPNLIMIKEAEIYSDNNPITWEVNTLKFTLSQDTDYIAIQLCAIENIYNDSLYPEFDGHYADFASVEVIPEPATLLLLGLGAVILRKRAGFPLRWNDRRNRVTSIENQVSSI
jgi:hypothetical protein